MDESDIYKLWRSRENVLSMLEKRKYDITEKDHMTFDEFMNWAKDEGYMEEKKDYSMVSTMKKRESVQVIKTYWLLDSKLGGVECRNISIDMENNSIKNAIIIVRDSITSHSKTTLKLLAKQNNNIHTFTLSEMQIDIFKHEKVPEHIICSPLEKRKVMEVYNVNVKQLPMIKITDPVIKRLGAKRGQLIKIIYKSKTLLGYNSITYRIVI